MPSGTQTQRRMRRFLPDDAHHEVQQSQRRGRGQRIMLGQVVVVVELRQRWCAGKAGRQGTRRCPLARAPTPQCRRVLDLSIQNFCTATSCHPLHRPCAPSHPAGPFVRISRASPQLLQPRIRPFAALANAGPLHAPVTGPKWPGDSIVSTTAVCVRIMAVIQPASVDGSPCLLVLGRLQTPACLILHAASLHVYVCVMLTLIFQPGPSLLSFLFSELTPPPLV